MKAQILNNFVIGTILKLIETTKNYSKSYGSSMRRPQISKTFEIYKFDKRLFDKSTGTPTGTGTFQSLIFPDIKNWKIRK